MKYIFFACLIFVISCSNNSIGYKGNQTNFPIDSIIKITKGPVDIVIIENIRLEKLPKIDSSFFVNYFEGLPTAENVIKLEYEYQPYWYFFDHRDLGDKVMFSILGDNESGYTVLYYLIFDKISKKIISADHLSSYEGDGGHFTNEKLVWENNRFIAFSVSGSMEDLNDSLIVQYKDSSCYEYSLSRRGFVTKEIFNFSKMDTSNYLVK